MRQTPAVTVAIAIRAWRPIRGYNPSRLKGRNSDVWDFAHPCDDASNKVGFAATYSAQSSCIISFTVSGSYRSPVRGSLSSWPARMLPDKGLPTSRINEAPVGLCVMPSGVMLNWSRLTKMLATVAAIRWGGRYLWTSKMKAFSASWSSTFHPIATFLSDFPARGVSHGAVFLGSPRTMVYESVVGRAPQRL